MRLTQTTGCRIMFFQAVWFGQIGQKRLPFANHSPIVVTNCQQTAIFES